MLEACVQMGFKTKLSNNGIVVAIYVGVDTVHALEYLSDHRAKGLREWNAYQSQYDAKDLGTEILPILLGKIASLSILA